MAQFNLYPLPENPSAPPPFADSLLEILQWGLTIYQARGLTQTLEVIGAAQQQERDVNGTLIDLSNPAFRKYSSTLTCKDVRTPPFDALWPGMTLDVHCACYLVYLPGNSGSPARNEVSGSSVELNGFIFYRPALTMMVKSVSWQYEDWKADVGWNLKLEEI